MGYQATFAPTAEAMEKYNKKSDYYSGYNGSIENRLTLLITTLLEPTEKKINVSQFVFNTKLSLALLQAKVEADEKKIAYNRWKEDENHELWFCGWEFSKDEPDTTIEEATESVIKRLTILHYCGKTEGYFEENSKFFDKMTEIEELLDYFEDAVRTNTVFSIMHDLDEFRERDDDYEEEIKQSKEIDAENE